MLPLAARHDTMPPRAHVTAPARMPLPGASLGAGDDDITPSILLFLRRLRNAFPPYFHDESPTDFDILPTPKRHFRILYHRFASMRDLMRALLLRSFSPRRLLYTTHAQAYHDDGAPSISLSNSRQQPWLVETSCISGAHFYYLRAA